MYRLLLMLVYYLVVTPLGIAYRALSDPLHRAWEPQRRTYWSFTDPSSLN